jgi:hypothetical protein
VEGSLLARSEQNPDSLEVEDDLGVAVVVHVGDDGYSMRVRLSEGSLKKTWPSMPS